MASDRDRRQMGQGWLATLLGVLVLVTGGFLLGLVVGVVSEEPGLVAGHMAGRSTPIDWAEQREVETAVGHSPAWFATGRDEPRESPSPIPPVAAPPPRAAESEQSNYMIQVGAFAEGIAANGLADRLRAGGYSVRVVSPQEDDRWRVRVGPVADRVTADRIALRLKSKEQLPTWILRQSGS